MHHFQSDRTSGGIAANETALDFQMIEQLYEIVNDELIRESLRRKAALSMPPYIKGDQPKVGCKGALFYKYMAVD